MTISADQMQTLADRLRKRAGRCVITAYGDDAYSRALATEDALNAVADEIEDMLRGLAEADAPIVEKE